VNGIASGVISATMGNRPGSSRPIIVFFVFSMKRVAALPH
jgi:hypothetical protein